MQYDVRTGDGQITEIIFAHEQQSGYVQAFKITNSQKFARIHDSEESVIVQSKEHAENLIKALNKAIELGWLK